MKPEDTLTRLRKPDVRTMAQIHDRHYPDVYRYVQYRLGDQQLSEDISSEVFMRLLDALHKRGGPAKNLRGWLIGTASNLVNDHLRNKYKQKIEQIDDEDTFIAPTTPEAALDIEQQHQQLRQAIDRLTFDQQHVLALRFVEGFSLEQTARQMKKSVNAVKALQFRAVESLKRIMGSPAQQQPPYGDSRYLHDD